MCGQRVSSIKIRAEQWEIRLGKEAETLGPLRLHWTLLILFQVWEKLQEDFQQESREIWFMFLKKEDLDGFLENWLEGFKTGTRDWVQGVSTNPGDRSWNR